MKTLAAVGSGVAVAFVMSLAVPAGAASDDQARLDAVMEAFNERMTEVGWESQGPSDGTLGNDDDDESSDEPSEGDEMMAECFGDLPAVFEDLEGSEEFPGQTATSSSDEFTFPAPTTDTATTDSMFSIPDEEELMAMALSVDEAHVDLVGDFVDALGAKETSECMKEAMEADLTVDGETTDPLEALFEFEVDVTTLGDLGVGEDSAQMAFAMSVNMFGQQIDFVGTMVFAGVGNDLIGLIHYTTGTAEPRSGLDPVAELQAIVDSISS